MKGMREAVDEIKRAAAEKKKVCVYGDYDCDGVTSVTLLLYAFSRFMDEDKIDYYIPERKRDGYGLNMRSVKEVADRGTDLMITVDCGCSSCDEVEYAKSLGMEVIVTDHHIVPEKTPDCVMLDPKQPGCGYPFDGLCGCGVAYKLVQALQREIGLDRSVLIDSLDIVGIATIGDIVPLRDENRTLAKYGIDRVRRTKRAGLRALMSAISLRAETIDSTSVAFGIVPNINANGRMERADTGVELLSCGEGDAAALAEKTVRNNRSRKDMQENAFGECLDLAALQCPGSLFPIIYADVHEGVAGIVAGKVKEELGRPVVIVTENDGKLKGTGRSIEGVDIHAILARCGDIFEKFGGHSGACGFTMAKENLPVLRDRAEREMEKIVDEDPSILDGGVKYDMELSLEDIDLGLAEEIEMMEPFGKDNERPVFMVRGVEPAYGKLMGADNKHIRFTGMKDGSRIGCVCFGKADEYRDLIFSRQPVDIIGEIEINEWNGNRTVQMNVKQIAESR